MTFVPFLIEPVVAPGFARLAQPVLDLNDFVLRPWQASDASAIAAAHSEPSIQHWHGRSFTHHANGLSSSYSSFSQAADQVVNARVWGGIHWRTSCTVGRAVGDQVGRYVRARPRLTADRQA